MLDEKHEVSPYLKDFIVRNAMRTKKISLEESPVEFQAVVKEATAEYAAAISGFPKKMQDILRADWNTKLQEGCSSPLALEMPGASRL